METDAWSTWLHQVTESLADPDYSRLSSFYIYVAGGPDTNFHTFLIVIIPGSVPSTIYVGGGLDTNFHTFYNRSTTVKAQIVQKRFKHSNISCNDL